MTTVEIINFAITLILGGASIAISIFAYISSSNNNNNSQIALDKIKELTHEIRANLFTSIANQKDYTNKMLDTIISKSIYGENIGDISNNLSYEETINEIVDLKSKEIENNLNKYLESKLSNLNESISNEAKETILQLKSSLGDLNIISQQGMEDNLPFSIKEQLIKWKRYPAFLLILGAIIKEKVKDIKTLKRIANDYCFPGEWEEGGLFGLERAGIIIIINDEIIIPSSIERPLEDWKKENWQFILQLRAFYKDKNSDLGQPESVTDEERKIGSKFKI